MPRKHTLEEIFESLRRLRSSPVTAESIDELKRVIAKEGSHAVARAAAIVGELELASLAPDLTAAFDRFMNDPLKNDKGSVAKTAIAEALVRLGHDDEKLYLRGIRHVQMEPTYGGRVDTASGLRSACAFGLAHTHYPGTLVELAHALADPEPAVRGSAARAVAVDGRDAGVPLLHLKAVTGDAEPHVLTDCLVALLALAPEASVPFAAGFLDSRDTAVAEAAALALGESRREAAFTVLRDWFVRGLPAGLRRTALLAIAMLRRDEGIDFLLGVVKEGATGPARDAVAALGIYRDNPSVGERLREAAQGRSDLE